MIHLRIDFLYIFLLVTLHLSDPTELQTWVIKHLCQYELWMSIKLCNVRIAHGRRIYRYFCFLELSLTNNSKKLHIENKPIYVRPYFSITRINMKIHNNIYSVVHYCPTFTVFVNHLLHHYSLSVVLSTHVWTLSERQADILINVVPQNWAFFKLPPSVRTSFKYRP